MTDAFKGRIQIGDIVVRIYDWGPYGLSIVTSFTPAGYARTTTFNADGDAGKGSTLKNGDNVIILDENLLRLHCNGENRIADMLLNKSREAKEQLENN